MSKKERYGKFKKKDYVRTIENTVWYLCDKFGYKTKPYLIETELKDGSLMGYMYRPKRSVIIYDYKAFKRAFGDYDYDTQEAYASAITAHETRHYYQYRQMYSKKPKEKESVIDRWKRDRDNEMCSNALTNGEYCMQPLELDAFLFEYVFGAHVFRYVLLKCIFNEEHLDALENLYMEYYGETDERLFGEEIHADVREREKNRAKKE